MKKVFAWTLSVALLAGLFTGCSSAPATADTATDTGSSIVEPTGDLAGEITFWHSFTQGARLDTIQAAADDFVAEHPGVTINIETFSWNDFYTKWTTGLASGSVPDMSTGLPGQVVEMIDAGAIIPLNDLIDQIGADKFSDAALNELTVDGNHYGIPLYSHAQVMWVRTDLLEANNLNVPETWDEFYEAAVTLTKDGVYGCSFPTGSTDFQGTNFLNFYVRSGGGSLLNDDLSANITSDLAIEGIEFWLKVYENCSPEDSISYDVLDQATLYYQGKTAFDFNSGFQIGGVETNSPDLLQYVDCYPIPKINKEDDRNGITTSNTPMVIWKNAEHPEICAAFMATLLEEENYIDFLHAQPVGMLPSVAGISDLPAYQDNEIIQQFSHAESVIADAVAIGTGIGFEHGPNVQAGVLVNQRTIENMFQDIITNGTDVRVAAQAAEDELNSYFSQIQ